MALYEKTVGDSVSTSDSIATTNERTLDESISLSFCLVIVLSDGSGSQIEVVNTDEIEVEETPIGTYGSKSVSDTISLSDSLSADFITSLRVSNIRALTSNKIRIDFEESVQINAALIDPASYSFNPITGGAESIFAQSVVLPPGQSYPLYVEVIVNEMTDDAEYEGAVTGAVISSSGRPIYSEYMIFAGIGQSPTVILVLAKDKNTVEVQFSEVMESNAAILDSNNYSFDGGLVVQSVESLEGSLVTLKTSDQTEGQLYNLTVKGILYSNPIDYITTNDQITAQIL